MSDWAGRLIANGHADAQMVAEVERVLEAAALRPGDTVLDVGSGLGLLTLAAHDRIGDGWVIAVDPSVAALEELLRLAHEVDANGIMYLVGDAEVLPLPDASIDAAVLRSVLVQVVDLECAVRELARVLRPDGRLSLGEPLDGGATALSTAVDWSPVGSLGARVVALSHELSASGPLRRLDADVLAAVLEASGFVELDTSIEDPGESWQVTAESVEARLDARAAPGSPTLRESWQEAFEVDGVDALVAHLKSLAGQTITFRRPHLYLSARRAAQ